MSTPPVWVKEIVQDFGRQLGLKQFMLNDKGAAGVRFENGTVLAFEYGMKALIISVRLPMTERKEALCMLLAQSHYARGTVVIRACYLKRTGEGSLSFVLPEGELTVNAIGAVFQNLWNTAEYLRRKLEWQ